MMTHDQAHQAIDQLADSAHDLVDRILPGDGPAADSGAAILERLPEQPEQLLEMLAGYAREHPLSAAAATLAAGYIVSQLL